MDEPHFVNTLRDVALNLFRARLAPRPEDWRCSSTRALIAVEADHVVKFTPALLRGGNVTAFLGEEFGEAPDYAALCKAESVGHPVGSTESLGDIEARTGKRLRLMKRGSKAEVE